MRQVTDRNFIFRVHRVIRAVEESTGLSEIDLATKSILSFVADRTSDGAKIRVLDVVRQDRFGTAPTVCGRLAELEEAGWVESHTDPEDGRARLLFLTKRSKSAFSKMSAAVIDLLDTHLD